MKKRIIPVVFALDGFLVRSEGFEWHQKLGNLTAQVERYSQWNLDELIYIDIGASRNPDVICHDYYSRFVTPVAEVCRMPLTFGGGIINETHAEKLFRFGADKIVISSAAIESPSLIESLVSTYGSQAICVSLDIKLVDDEYYLTGRAGKKIYKKVKIKDHIHRCQDLGCGEFFLNAVHRDGYAKGFDIPLINQITKLISVPLVSCGGANSLAHFREGLDKTASSALAAGNFFNFRELSYPILKTQLYKSHPKRIRKPS